MKLFVNVFICNKIFRYQIHTLHFEVKRKATKVQMDVTLPAVFCCGPAPSDLDVFLTFCCVVLWSDPEQPGV